MKIAAAAYPIDWHNRWNDYVGKLRVWTRTARDQGAELLVFPEYASMELASLAEAEIAGDLARSIEAVQARLPDVDSLHASLAREFGVYICAGSAPARRPDRLPANRARLFAPDGSVGHQDKMIMTRFEREEWGIGHGDALRIFDTELGRIGILICYDSEFPLLARRLVEAGAEILLVPSCTDTMQGYWRVRIGAMARALEGQCVVVQAPTIGDAKWLAAADVNVGAAAIYGPPDGGFPDDGVIAQGKVGEAGWVYADVSLDAIREVRETGAVFNMKHWPEQDERPAEVETVRLGAADADQATTG
ncbi:MAG: carbon-nitrogen hydrolase family protein [Rhodobacteraceae bacterium]|nr:carbon-nitrogen hydrolase family protein [Paracoccaceae bacterium]